MNRIILRISFLLIIISVLFLECTNVSGSKDEIKLWPEIEPFESGYLKGV